MIASSIFFLLFHILQIWTHKIPQTIYRYSLPVFPLFSIESISLLILDKRGLPPTSCSIFGKCAQMSVCLANLMVGLFFIKMASFLFGDAMMSAHARKLQLCFYMTLLLFPCTIMIAFVDWDSKGEDQVCYMKRDGITFGIMC